MSLTNTRGMNVTGSNHFRRQFACVLFGLGLAMSLAANATPANKTALAKYYDRFFATNLNSCTTCHLPAKLAHPPENLDEFPHNPFGARLREVGKKLVQRGENKSISQRLALIASEDADGDGVPNEIELLLGHAPGDAQDKPSKIELAGVTKLRGEFARFQAASRWEPFQTVNMPAVPKAKNSRWARNPIDAFIAAEQESRNLKPRPEATREILLRRVYLDLIGLSPTPDEQAAFARDRSPDAYEKVVERLLNDPRYGERWGRHWMDVWRYSDWAGWTDGGQVRDSKPHIWRWRDWIVESLNHDKGYDRMVVEMLAADELAPEDTDALRATGFLVRNYRMLSREQWLEDTIKHTSQAFLGVTMGCAKCHDHMFDPISQNEYYRLRAVFEPHQVRTDRVPGQLDTAKDGLVRVFDTDTNAPTYFFVRGDERKPDTNQVMSPGVPLVFGGFGSGDRGLKIEPLKLPRLSSFPDKREFVVKETVAASEKDLAEARKAFGEAKKKLAKSGDDQSNATATNLIAAKRTHDELQAKFSVATNRYESLLAVLLAERLEDLGQKDTEEWKQAATAASAAQRKLAVAEAAHKLMLARQSESDAQSKAAAAAQATNSSATDSETKTADEKLTARKKSAENTAKDLEAAKKKTTEAEKALADAETELKAAPSVAFKPRPTEKFPAVSTGRRLAFARWVADKNNPLTARVAMNHLWLRHFGRGIVPTPADFGGNGRPATHPQLLDWLAARFMSENWSMKAMHRLMVTSRTYRMASTPDEANARIDPDNIYLWRMPSRRMEAEAVRDNVLYVSSQLDATMGGPEVDHKLGLESKRRSLYLRQAAEKEVEFLKIFDGPSVTECYERKPSVVPQQALALANSELAIKCARLLADSFPAETADAEFVAQMFRRILARAPTAEELRQCAGFLREQVASNARRNLVLVLFNHNDYVTIR
ncbi:MAG: DUF1553 domain-containing protein [Verrucomicrobia bacterium]|nr:DUF1553 domain-containing protein [Verrucomicrobiota bacterium]